MNPNRRACGLTGTPTCASDDTHTTVSGSLMRSVIYPLLGYILALLLAGTSPVGAGQGAHEGQLLDALVPHLHFVDGQRVVREARLPASNDSHPGPALGAAAGASATAAGVGLMPPVPGSVISLRTTSEEWRFAAADSLLPRGRTEAPPDPPPTLWS
jgi:hypothetical protein